MAGICLKTILKLTIICKISLSRVKITFWLLLLCTQLSNIYSIKCWSCGYAEDEDGNRIPIPSKFRDQNIPFCEDFIDENSDKNLTKEYPKVGLITFMVLLVTKLL